MRPELIIDARANLGEGPAWDMVANRLYWVDIHAGVLHCYDPQSESDYRHSFGEPVSCIAPCHSTWISPGGLNGDAILALKSGIILLNQLCDDWGYVVQPEPHLPGNRFNDGKCDPAGRFLAGTMDDAEKEASGSLYSYSPNGTLKLF